MVWIDGLVTHVNVNTRYLVTVSNPVSSSIVFISLLHSKGVTMNSGDYFLLNLRLPSRILKIATHIRLKLTESSTYLSHKSPVFIGCTWSS